MYGNIDRLSLLEQTELMRRRTNLLLYLVRSPFYDKFTKDVIFSMIMFTRNNVPFGKTISEILLSYIPHYRRIYGYLWSY